MQKKKKVFPKQEGNIFSSLFLLHLGSLFLDVPLSQHSHGAFETRVFCLLELSAHGHLCSSET